MEPVQYVRILRRHLRLILAFTVVGAILGLASGLAADTESTPTDRTFYAAHVLIDENPAESPANLGLAQLLATSGEVPNRVAEQLGGDPLDLAASIRVLVDSNLRTMQIAAIGNDPDQAELVADTFAAELASFLVERDQSERDTQAADLQEQIDRLQADFAELVAAREGLPSDEAALNDAQQQAVANQITELQQQLDQLESRPLPSEQLTTLQTASAVEVTSRQLNDLLASGSNSQRNNNGNRNSAPTATVLPATSGTTSSAGDQTSITDHPVVRAGVGGLLGLLAGAGLALLIQRFDPRLRSKEDAEEAFGLPVVAEIPVLPRNQQDRAGLLTLEAPRSPTAEAYRSLRSSLVFLEPGDATGDGPFDAAEGTETGGTTDAGTVLDGERTGAAAARVIMVTSPGPSEGKTTTSANLAVVLAEAGYSVLAINCDFRKPRLHLYLRGQDTPRRVVETAAPGVRMITDVVADSSRLNPAEIVSAQRHVVQQARSMFDVIVLDTAPLLTTNDAVDLLPEVDLVVAVCRAGRTTHEAARRTAEVLRRHHAPMGGCVLVGATDGPSARYYYYYGDERPTTSTPDARGGEPDDDRDSPVALTTRPRERR